MFRMVTYKLSGFIQVKKMFLTQKHMFFPIIYIHNYKIYIL